MLVARSWLVLWTVLAAASLLVTALVGIWSSYLLALGSPGLSQEPMVAVRGTVVSVGPPRVANAAEIDEILRVAAAEGVPRSEVWLPDPYLGACSVTYTYPVADEVMGTTDLDPRETGWCDLAAGAAIDVSYPVGRPAEVADDYDAAWERTRREMRTWTAVAAGVSVLFVALAATTLVTLRRREVVAGA